MCYMTVIHLASLSCKQLEVAEFSPCTTGLKANLCFLKQYWQTGSPVTPSPVNLFFF